MIEVWHITIRLMPSGVSSARYSGSSAKAAGAFQRAEEGQGRAGRRENEKDQCRDRSSCREAEAGKRSGRIEKENGIIKIRAEFRDYRSFARNFYEAKNTKRQRP